MNIPKGAPRVAFVIYLLLMAGCVTWMSFLVRSNEALSIFVPFLIVGVNSCVFFLRLGAEASPFEGWAKDAPWTTSAFTVVFGYIVWVTAAQTMVRFTDDDLGQGGGTFAMALAAVPLLATSVLFTFSRLPVWRTLLHGGIRHRHLRSDRKDSSLRTDHEY